MIADKIELPGRNGKDADVSGMVHAWLCKSQHDWLIVLDNIDDAEVYHGLLPSGNGSTGGKSVRREMSDLVPTSSNGAIVITTRCRDVGFQLTGRYEDIYEVNPMAVGDALSLLRPKLGPLYEKTNGTQLVTKLDFIPLAISQAAAYIRKRQPHVSVAQYLEKFSADLLKHESPDDRRYKDVPHWIVITWQISFRFIREKRPTAAGVLSLMSQLDRQGIPTKCLQLQPLSEKQRAAFISDDSIDVVTLSKIADGTETPFPQKMQSFRERPLKRPNSHNENEEITKALIDDFVMLQELYFIRAEIDGSSFEMHALVQLSTQDWLRNEGLLLKWQYTFMCIMSSDFPTGQSETRATCELLLPHVLSMVSSKPEASKWLRMWADVLNRLTSYALERGLDSLAAENAHLAELETKLRLGADILIITIAKPDLTTLRCEERLLLSSYLLTASEASRHMAAVLRRDGKFDKAIEKPHDLIISSAPLKEVEPSNVVPHLAAMDLAMVLNQNRQYEEAQKFIAQAIAGFEKNIKEQHYVYQATNVQGLIQSSQCKFEESEESFRAVVAGFESIGLSRKHDLRTIEAAIEVGVAMVKQKTPEKLEGGRVVLQEAMESLEDLVGAEDYKTKTCVLALSSCLIVRCRSQSEGAVDRRKEAEALFAKDQDYSSRLRPGDCMVQNIAGVADLFVK